MFRKLLVLLLLLSLLAACNSETLTFSGEAENWSAELEIVQNGDSYEEQELELQYKGNDISTVGEIDYMVDTNAGSFGASGRTLQDNGVLKDASNSSPLSDSAKVMEESQVEMTVEWNGHTETIILNNH